MTFFVSNEVKLHPTDTERVPDFLAAHTGTLVSPPHSPTRRDELGPYDSYIFDVEGKSWYESECDLVIAGLGWVSITGTGKCKVKITAPRGISVTQRPALLPFESTGSTAKFSGGRIVRKARKKGKGEKKSYGWRA
jgi:hypothetical protein